MMEEDFNHDIEQIFINWCVARGFTSETPHLEVFLAMADEAQQRIEAAAARGERVIKRIDFDGSIFFETIEEAKQALRDFKQVLGLN